jgi:glycosyltransferase involved in cell wall biosynthesis
MTWSVMKASDIFVLSSRSEGVPYALLEAAALQLPILSTRCGGIPEIFIHEQDALLVGVADPSSISAGIVRLCEDKSLAQKLAVNAKAKISSEYSLSAQIAAIRHAYRKALDSRQGRIHEDLSVALH